MQQKTPIREGMNFTTFHRLNSGSFVSIVPIRPQETNVAFHDPQGAAGILSAERSEKRTAGKMPEGRCRRGPIGSRFLDQCAAGKARKVISTQTWAHARA